MQTLYLGISLLWDGVQTSLVHTSIRASYEEDILIEPSQAGHIKIWSYSHACQKLKRSSKFAAYVLVGLRPDEDDKKNGTLSAVAKSKVKKKSRAVFEQIKRGPGFHGKHGIKTITTIRDPDECQSPLDTTIERLYPGCQDIMLRSHASNHNEPNKSQWVYSKYKQSEPRKRHSGSIPRALAQNIIAQHV